MKKMIIIILIFLFFGLLNSKAQKKEAEISAATTTMVKGHVNSQYDAITGYTAYTVVCDGSGMFDCEISTENGGSGPKQKKD